MIDEGGNWFRCTSMASIVEQALIKEPYGDLSIMILILSYVISIESTAGHSHHNGSLSVASIQRIPATYTRSSLRFVGGRPRSRSDVDVLVLLQIWVLFELRSLHGTFPSRFGRVTRFTLSPNLLLVSTVYYKCGEFCCWLLWLLNPL